MNRKNLEKLRDYLWSLPEDYEHFDMVSYYARYGTRVWNELTADEMGLAATYLNPCGTTACAAGHGPAAGIPIRHDESWTTYQHRVFALNTKEFDWCFTGNWDETDNTHYGAAARIDWMLKHGVPTDAYGQITGDAPLCYQQERPTISDHLATTKGEKA
jgi:hypothetical protein